MRYAINPVAGKFQVIDTTKGGPAPAIGQPYATEEQAKRRARDLNRKARVTELKNANDTAVGLGKVKTMLAKASSAVKKSPAKKAAASVKKAPTKSSAPAQSEKKQVVIAPRIDAANPAPTKPSETKPVANGAKNGKASTAAKAPADAPKPKLCKAVPKDIDGKPVSNYRGVRLAIEAEGADAGLAHGLALGLPLSQVKAYVKELLVIIEKSKNKPPKGEKKSTADTPARPWEPDFRYTSYDKAWSFAVHQARRCGFAETHFHILSENGKFAVAPISYKTPGEVPQFEVGDRVMDTIIKDSRGTIVGAGPVQSEVQYDDKTRFGGKVQCVPNVYLYKLSGPEAKPVKAPAKKKGETPDSPPRKMKVPAAGMPAKKSAKKKGG